MIIRRDDYLNRLIESKHTHTIKVVSGIRRCGKSFLLFELFADHLRDSGIDESHILTYELDMLENTHLRDKNALYQDILSKITGDGMPMGYVPQWWCMVGHPSVATFPVQW